MERPDYYVYVIRVGGRTIYVGKGSGYRVNVSVRRSHNNLVRLVLAEAEAAGTPWRTRKIANGLTNRDAIRLEARIFEKVNPLCNKRNPYDEGRLAAEREEAEWNDFVGSEEYDSMFGGSSSKSVAVCLDGPRFLSGRMIGGSVF